MPDTHARTQIRAQVAEMLLGLATTGQRSYSGRPYPLQEPTELPGLVTIAPAEVIVEDASSMGGKIGRRLAFVVIGYDKGDDIEGRLDQIAMEVEQALGADPTLGGLVKDSELATTDVLIDGQGKQRTGEIRLTYSALYRTTRSAPETIIA